MGGVKVNGISVLEKPKDENCPQGLPCDMKEGGRTKPELKIA